MLGKDDLPQIFESFWRGANAENIRGSGLGTLYLQTAYAQDERGDFCQDRR